MRSAKYGTDVQSERKVKNMPGPGGGSRGGGFSGGGSRGGGFGGGFSGGGGGFRGGGFSPRPPRPHFYGGWYHRPYRYGYHGGGCLGGLASIILVPILVLCVSMIVIVSMMGSVISTVAKGGVVTYSEAEFQAYAQQQYDTFYGDVPASEYEEKLLLIFLTTEEMEEYYCIAWVGNEIRTEINYLFGNEQTAFGRVDRKSVV